MTFIEGIRLEPPVSDVTVTIQQKNESNQNKTEVKEESEKETSIAVENVQDKNEVEVAAAMSGETVAQLAEVNEIIPEDPTPSSKDKYSKYIYSPKCDLRHE